MKKTLLALSVAALAASSAQAYNFHIDQTGTDIDFGGSLRLKTENVDSRSNYNDREEIKDHEYRSVRNNGSRFGFKLKQDLGNDFYALGRVEWRFRGTAQSHHDFDDIYTRQLFAGFGHKKYGELVYGNMTVITDEVKKTDLPNTYSLSDGLLDHTARRAVQYTYKGKFDNQDLKVGVYYGGSSKRGNDGSSLLNATRKNTWGIGAIYGYQIDSLQKVTIGTGFTRALYNNSNAALGSYSQNAYAFDVAYKFDHTTYGIDLERRVAKNQAELGRKRTQNQVRTVVSQALNDDWNVYAMFAYKTDKTQHAAAAPNKEISREVMVGTEYYVYKQGSIKLKPFVEFQAIHKSYENTTQNINGVTYNRDSARDLKTLIGVRAYW